MARRRQPQPREATTRATAERLNFAPKNRRLLQVDRVCSRPPKLGKRPIMRGRGSGCRRPCWKAGGCCHWRCRSATPDLPSRQSCRWGRSPGRPADNTDAVNAPDIECPCPGDRAPGNQTRAGVGLKQDESGAGPIEDRAIRFAGRAAARAVIPLRARELAPDKVSGRGLVMTMTITPENASPP